ncbi:MAG: glycosyltransferase family 2 protein [Nitrospirae bacterium]|nr:glycosyltransferase family 2 protein [Nitrospirota bacterium]
MPGVSDGLIQGLSVVIPAYNEAGAIKDSIDAVKGVLLTIHRPSEIIVVDDGSSDNTADVAQQCGIRLIRHPINSGYGRSLLSGIEASSFETIAIVDADGTYPIERLHDLVNLYDRGFDMVVGARQGQHYEPSPFKRILRVFFRVLAEFTTGQPIPDINSGFRIFSRAPVLEYRASISSGFSFTTTITLFFMLSNLLVGYLPILYNRRRGSSKVNLFWDTLRSLQIIFTAIARFNPLKLYLLLLVLNSLGNLILMILLGTAFATYFLVVMLAILIAWNVNFIIIAVAFLAVGLGKPSSNMTASLYKRRERERDY